MPALSVPQCCSHQQDGVLLSTQVPSPTNPSERNGLRMADRVNTSPSADLYGESSECEESDESQRVEPQVLYLF